MATKKFDTSPIEMRPKDGGEVTVSSPGQVVQVGTKDDDELPMPVRGIPAPPVGVKMLRGNEVVASLELGAADLDTATELRALQDWLGDQGAADKLLVDIRASQVSLDQLRPLIRTAREHAFPIDVRLSGDD